MNPDLATFVVAAALAFGGGLVAIALGVALWRHFRWSRRMRRRVGWYT
jgi:hypothetical protein